MSLNFSLNSTFLQFAPAAASLELSKANIYSGGLATVSFVLLIAFVNGFAWNWKGFPTKRGIPFVGSWGFFTSRYAFIQEGLQKFGNYFYFNVIHVSENTHVSILYLILLHTAQGFDS